MPNSVICDLLELLQFPCRTFHSIETGLVKVFNDLALALDERRSGILVLLDLSAAFDILEQNIFIKEVFGM